MTYQIHDAPEPAAAPAGQPITFRTPQEAKAAMVAAQGALRMGQITARQYDDIREAAQRAIDPLHAALKDAEAQVEQKQTEARVKRDATTAATSPKT